ncbi:hypothetical protein FOH10_16135 [Nocardia otitidiscaviarum]|uniref:Uncharacterized protein n=1 Tax=Nocardia otitidiscaviarum TaxID=1823 RepID=A0A516NM91_9NOCA|nr:hypothetical protein [Nocardia otitidiscaviarum]MCP9624845.1 hypothetical protein [Nocardia otitidiscaviarum]QDP80011.1 hypothetical protein FOH10_16135 [Nocardia otitidiscaviarum]
MTEELSPHDLLSSGHYGQDAIRAVESLKDTGREANCPEFTDRLASILIDGLRVLDSLPRDEPFWRGTNAVATLYKLGNHAVERLEATPDDRTARWVLVASALAAGSSDGGLSWLGPLITADAVVVHDAVMIADIVQNLIGLNASEALRQACAGVDREELRRRAPADGDAASGRVLALLEGDQ